MSKTVLRTDALMVPIAQFSHGLRVGGEIHLGATAGTDAKRRLAGSTPGLTDARAQADRMYRNMKLALELLGGSVRDVVRLKTYVTDWRDLAACEEVYAEHFRAPHPSRSTVGTWGFPLPFAVIEAELTAVVGRTAGHTHGVVGGEDVAQALANLASELDELRDLVKLTVTLADHRDYAMLDEALMQMLRPPYPARTVSVAPLSDPARRVEIEFVASAGGGEPVDLYRMPGAASPAMRTATHLYLSAQPGIEADGHVASEVQTQTRAAWRRIHAIVEAAGLDPADIVRTNNWLTDWRSYNGFNAGYGDFVQPPYPPRATVIGGMLQPAALVQIEALAHREGRNATVLECNQ
jgi:aminoacrylate peracid reductase